ncbi:MAG: phospho-N-acetylmuramoyl-pentapeptide-transferase [Phycisphaerales bacterium]|nr:phospho-N-acetylmuramoyl-pentapeptide-transferase [Phycisphaerales bacterium]
MLYNFWDIFRDKLDSMGIDSLFMVLDQITFRTVASVIVSFFFVIIAGRPTIRWLLKQKIGDAPEFYNADLNKLMMNKANTPTMGGLLIAGGIAFSTLLLADLTNFYIHMALICLLWLTVLGGVDDWLKLTASRRSPGRREGLYTWEKLVFQLGLAILLGYFLFTHGHNKDELHNLPHVLCLPFQKTWIIDGINPSLIFLPLPIFMLITVLVVTATSNAVNLTDGMDGLAGGIVGVIAFAMAVLCLIAGTPEEAQRLLLPYIPGSAELAVVAGGMAGACIGFLWFNCAPAQVFMGDAGSLSLGGLLAYIAVAIRHEILLAVIGGVLVIEVLSVIIQVGYFKITKGKRVFRCAPIHHHFHLVGWTEQQVVVRFWLITMVLAALGLAIVKLR